MPLVSNSNDQIPAATTPTSGNSGGAGDTAYSNVTITTGSDLVSSTTQRAHSNQALALSGTNGTAFVGWNGYSVLAMTARAYFFPTATPSVATVLMQPRSVSLLAANIAWNTSGQLIIQDAASATTVLGTITTLYSTWVRVDLALVVATSTTGTLKAQYYAGDSNTVHGTCTPFSTTTGNAGTANLTEFRVGRIGGTTSGTHYVDDPALQDGAVLLPFLPPITPRIPLLTTRAAVGRASMY